MPDKTRAGAWAVFPFLFLTLLAILYFLSAFTGEVLLTERDLSAFFIPPRLLWVDAVRGGEFPLWNPYSYGGHPLFATLQPGVLYPVNILLLLLPFDLAFNWTVIAHFIMAGSFASLLLRELGARRAGSLCGALVFMLSGYLFSVHNVISTLFTVAWVPLALLLFLRALRRGSLRYALLAGVVLAVMFMAGGIEVLFGTALLLAAAAAHPPALLVPDGAGPVRRGALLLAAFAVLLALSAVQLIPFLELAARSTRAGGLSYFEATTWSFGLKDFVQFFIPDPYGYGTSNEKYWGNQSWLKTVYLGALPFVLSLFFLRSMGRRALPFVLLALAFLALAMGGNTAIYRPIFDHLPFFDKIRYPVKFLFAPFLFISIAAGLGFEALREGLAKKDPGARRAVVALLAASTAAALALGLMSLYDDGIRQWLASNGYDYPEYNKAAINIFNAKRVLFFFILSSVALYSAAASARPAALLAFLVPALLSADLFFAHNGYYQATEPAEYHSKGEVLEFLSQDKDGPFRVLTTPVTAKLPWSPAKGFSMLDMDKARITGHNLSHRIFDVGGVEVMMRSDYSFVHELAASQAAPDATSLLPMLNVKYLVSALPISSERFALVKSVEAGTREDGQPVVLRLYEDRNYLPRFFVAHDYRVIRKPDEYLGAILDRGFDPGRLVLLEREPPVAKAQPSGAANGYGVEILSYRNNSVELKVRAESDGLLVASESWYPGWKAYVDGVETELLRADLVLRAVAVSKGEHIVRFVYCPASFKAGLAISSLSALALAAFFAAPLASRRRRKEAAS